MEKVTREKLYKALLAAEAAKNELNELLEGGDTFEIAKSVQSHCGEAESLLVDVLGLDPE